MPFSPPRFFYFFAALFITIILFQLGVTNARVITIHNHCNFTVYPAMFTSSNTGSPEPSQTGWVQQSGEVYVLSTPSSWTGRIWARTSCNFSNQSILQNCETGFCVGGRNCVYPGVPPITLAELNLQDTDYYDISNVDGFNIGLALAPSNPLCTIASCEADINLVCPEELQIKNAQGRVVACNSACVRFGSSEFCCTKNFSTPDKCGPTYYSNIFKTACPGAYSYAYDDLSSLFLCSPSDYALVFCPKPGEAVPRPTYKPIPTNTTNTTTTSHGATIGVCDGKTYFIHTHICEGNQICPINMHNCNGACYSPNAYHCCHEKTLKLLHETC